MVCKKKWNEKPNGFQRAVMYNLPSARDSLDCVLCIISSISHALYRAFEPTATLWNPPKSCSCRDYPLITMRVSEWLLKWTLAQQQSTTGSGDVGMETLPLLLLLQQRCPVFFYTMQSFSFSLHLRQHRSSVWRDTQFHTILTSHFNIRLCLQTFYVTTSQMYLRKSEFLQYNK